MNARKTRALYLTLTSSLMLALVTGCSHNKTVDDATLTGRVKTALSSDSTISQQPVQYGVKDGVVTLYGNVSDDTASAVAAKDVSRVAGVKEVVNNLSVDGIAVAPTVTTGPDAQPQPTTPQQRAAIAQNQPLPPPDTSSAPPPPVYHDVRVPPGTRIPVRITQSLDSARTQTGQTFNGVVTHEVVVDGYVVIPAGSAVSGRVVLAKDATHYAGNSLLDIKLDAVRIRGNLVSIDTDHYEVEGKGRGRNTAEKIGGGAAIGAILGGIFGGGKGAAIGAAAGGGGGAVVQGVTRGQQVGIPSESVIHFHLAAPFTAHTAEQPYPSQNQESSTLQSR
jgi:hypothetical protein